MRQKKKVGQKAADTASTSTAFPRHSDWVKGGAETPLIVVVEGKDFKAASDWVNSRQPPSYAMPPPYPAASSSLPDVGLLNKQQPLPPTVATPSKTPQSPSSADVIPARPAGLNKGRDISNDEKNNQDNWKNSKKYRKPLPDIQFFIRVAVISAVVFGGYYLFSPYQNCIRAGLGTNCFTHTIW